MAEVGFGSQEPSLTRNPHLSATLSVSQDAPKVRCGGLTWTGAVP